MNYEKRNLEYLLYSINQLEAKLQDRIDDLVKNGASKETATIIAWQEFPKQDKDALQKLQTELKQIQ